MENEQYSQNYSYMLGDYKNILNLPYEVFEQPEF